MNRHSSLGWGLNRPSALPPQFNRRPSGQEHTAWAPVRPILSQCSRIRPEHGQTWLRPAQGSNTKLESLLEPEGPGLQAFFTRQHELQCLTGLLSTKPCAFAVIVGPASSGKTAMVEHYIEQLDLDGKALPVYIDCREVDVQTPDSFADALLRIVSSRMERLPTFAGAFLTALADNNLSNKVRLVDLESLPALSEIIAALSAMPGNSALARVLRSFQQGLDESRKQKLDAPKDQWQTLIIDEANALTCWTDTHPRELMTLLRCFVRITKQQNAAHVLLLTSNYAFIDWLRQGVKETFYRVEVVGDFCADEARKFFEMLKGRACEDDDWRQVYEMCGGNAGLLQIAALDSSRMPLRQALEDIKRMVYASVNGGLEPDDKDGWTQAQYATAVRRILAAPANAASACALKAQFGGGGAGKEVLQAMVRANLLAYRPASSWARDIERSAFGKDMLLVTAPTPADIACMRELELPEPAPSAGMEEEAIATSSVPLDNQELKDVSDQLGAVQQDINEVAAKIKQLKAEKPEGWLEEVRQLRKMQQHLQEKKLLLHEKELLLMRIMAG